MNSEEKSFLDYIICTNCKKKYPINEKLTLCAACGKVLFAKYDIEKAKETLTRKNLATRKIKSLWRFFEIMPVLNKGHRFSLGEGGTPLLQLDQLGHTFGLNNVFLKDEGQNPTGTFKSRGLCSAVSKAVELGFKEFVIPTAGNAGAALTAYCARSGSTAHIYMPNNSPKLIQAEIQRMGGDLHLIDGLISDAGKIAKEMSDKHGWYDVSTLKEPYRAEGKKTMGLELVEDFNFELPSAIIYPTGGGTGIVGMWKAFDELEQLGIIGSERPKMISVQSSTCAPIVKAFNKKQKTAEFWEGASTFASGLRVPSAVADYLILESIYESNGTAVAVSDETIKESMFLLAKKEGIMLSPEAAATVSCLEVLKNQNFFDGDEKIVLFGTGNGLTTPDEWL